MTQQVKVERELLFRGAAAYQGNSGLIIPKKKIFDSGFTRTAAYDGWSSTTGANGCTLAALTNDGGGAKMTMGGTDEDCGELYHTAQWSAAYSCGMLAKVKISAITDVCVTVGFVDAYENTNDHVAGEIDGTSYRNMSNTADWCGFTFDTDQTTDVWYVGCSNNGTEGTPSAALGSLAPVADTYFYVAVQTKTDGDVAFYYGTKIDNLVSVGYKDGGIAYASTNLLAPYIGFIAHSATALICSVSRVVVWQDN